MQLPSLVHHYPNATLAFTLIVVIIALLGVNAEAVSADGDST